MRRSVVPVAILILAPAVALAEPAAPGDTAPVGPGGQDPATAPAPVAVAAPGAVGLAPPGMAPMAMIDQPAPRSKATSTGTTGIARRNAVDAVADRVYLLSTAITPRAGTFSASWRATPIGDGAGIGAISVGLTDRISASAHIVYGGDADSIEGGAVQVQIYRHAGTAVAVGATLLGTDGNDAAGMATATLTQCLDRPCGTIVSLHAGALISTDADQEQVPVLGGASLVTGDGPIKFFTEMLSIEIDHDRLFGGTVGMRFGGRQFAFDLGVAFAAVDHDGGALPVIGLTGRL